MKVLIVAEAHFAALALAQRFLAIGHEVILCGSGYQVRQHWPKGLEIVHLDLTDWSHWQAIQTMLSGYQVDWLVDYSNDNSPQLLKTVQCRHYILVRTAQAYQNDRYRPAYTADWVDETAPRQPLIHWWRSAPDEKDNTHDLCHPTAITLAKCRKPPPRGGQSHP
jgi:nucleoside-diphosphate-sugar epimerase